LSVVAGMPGIFFAATILARVSLIALATAGAAGSPGYPIDCDKSDGPMKNTSTPSTLRMSSTLRMAASCSNCTQTSDCSLAAAVKSTIFAPSPQLSGRVPAANPRPAPEPNFTADTARRASSAVLTCETCTPMTPRSITLWISAFEFVCGRAMAVIPTASAAMAITSTSDSDSEPCSQSSSTQSKPAKPNISTICGDGNITEQPSAGCPASSLAFMRFGFIRPLRRQINPEFKVYAPRAFRKLT